MYAFLKVSRCFWCWIGFYIGLGFALLSLDLVAPQHRLGESANNPTCDCTQGTWASSSAARCQPVKLFSQHAYECLANSNSLCMFPYQLTLGNSLPDCLPDSERTEYGDESVVWLDMSITAELVAFKGREIMMVAIRSPGEHLIVNVHGARGYVHRWVVLEHAAQENPLRS